MKFLELTTARLRAPMESDIEKITAICQEPEIVAFATVPSSYRREHAEAFVTEAISHGWAATTNTRWPPESFPAGPRISQASGLGLQ